MARNSFTTLKLTWNQLELVRYVVTECLHETEEQQNENNAGAPSSFHCVGVVVNFAACRKNEGILKLNANGH